MPSLNVRATPTSVPTMSAMVHAPSASDNVQPSPLRIQSIYRLTPSGVVSNSKDIGDYPVGITMRLGGLPSLAVGLVARGLDQFPELVRLREFQIDVLRRNRALEPFGVELVVKTGLHGLGERVIDELFELRITLRHHHAIGVARKRIAQKGEVIRRRRIGLEAGA